jgi:hypothetical protein
MHCHVGITIYSVFPDWNLQYFSSSCHFYEGFNPAICYVDRDDVLKKSAACSIYSTYMIDLWFVDSFKYEYPEYGQRDVLSYYNELVSKFKRFLNSEDVSSNWLHFFIILSRGAVICAFKNYRKFAILSSAGPIRSVYTRVGQPLGIGHIWPTTKKCGQQEKFRREWKVLKLISKLFFKMKFYNRVNSLKNSR